MLMLLVILMSTMILAFKPSGRHHRMSVSLSLAPRDALIEEYSRVSEGSLLDIDNAARSKYIAELIAEGDLDEEELVTMFNAVAAGAEGIDIDGFVELCSRIDDLFEDDDDKEEGALEVDVDATTLATEILTIIEGKDPIRRDYDGFDEIITKVEALLLTAPVDITTLTEENIVGEWRLAYASSSSFAFNDGYTGVGKTTPGGATFVSLLQHFELKASGAKSFKVIETFATTVGGADLEVTVNGDWSIVQRTEPITRRPYILVEIKPRNVKYGLVVVDGNRVEKGWKTMRILNSLELVYLDSQLRIQRGAGGLYFYGENVRVKRHMQ